MADLVNIKQIQLSDGLHDIDAKYWNGHEWSELGNPLRFLGVAQTTVPTAGRYVKARVDTSGGQAHLTDYYIRLTTEGAATEVSAEKGDVFVVTNTGAEYLCIAEGTYPSSSWTSLGDETNFQLVGKTLVTSIPSTNTTSEAAAQNLTTSELAASTATGKASGSITYSYDTATETEQADLSQVATEAGTSEAGGFRIDGSDFQFSGTKKTLAGTFTVNGIAMADHAAQNLTVTGSQTIAAHSHAVNVSTATAAILTQGVSTTEAAGHTHTVTLASHLHEDDVTVTKITGYTAPSMSTINFTANETQSLTTKNYGFSAEQTVLASAQVSTLGVLSFGTITAGTQDVLSEGSVASLTGGVFNAGGLSYTNTIAAGSKTNASLAATVSEAGKHSHSFAESAWEQLTYVNGATLDTAGAATIDGSNFKAALPSLTHTQSGTASVNVSIDYTPTGSITGGKSVGDHSHGYMAPIAHSHGISMGSSINTISVELDASVNIAKHSHTVTVAAHTHDMGNHTHNVTTTNN